MPSFFKKNLLILLSMDHACYSIPLLFLEIYNLQQSLQLKHQHKSRDFDIFQSEPQPKTAGEVIRLDF